MTDPNDLVSVAGVLLLLRRVACTGASAA